MDKQQQIASTQKASSGGLPQPYQRYAKVAVGLFVFVFVAALLIGFSGNAFLQKSSSIIFTAPYTIFIGWLVFRYRFLIAGYTAFIGKNYQAARNFGERAVSAYPTDNIACEFAAAVNLTVYDSRRALELCDRVLSREPDRASGLTTRATANLFSGNYDASIADATAAVALQPNVVNPYVTRIAAYIGKFDYERAIEDSNCVLQRFPNVVVVKLNRAVAKACLNDRDGALCDLKDVIESSGQGVGKPFLANAYSLRASVFASQMVLDRAIADCDLAHKADPNFSFAYLQKAICFTRGHQFGHARESLETLSKLPMTDSSRANALAASARLKLAEKDMPGAVIEAKAAVEAAELPDCLATYGLALSRTGEHEAGLTALNRAIELDRHFAEAYFFRSEVRAARSRAEEAEDDKNLSLSLGYHPYL
jgi:tetratricopeptide (TPR) repeat protein